MRPHRSLVRRARLTDVRARFDDVRVLVRQLLGDEVGARVPPIWDLDDEGEIRGVYRELRAAPGVWPILGNLAWCRFYSKHMALRECLGPLFGMEMC